MRQKSARRVGNASPTPPRAKLLAMAVAYLMVFASSAGAVVFQVTRTDDPAPDGCFPGDCSLREAVLDANASPGADTVDLPAGTYVLTQGVLQIFDELLLLGAGARSTIVDGNAQDRVFLVNAAGPVELSGLTIRNGLAAASGGGILNAASVLTVSACSISENSAAFRGGGIHSTGELMLVGCTVGGNLAGTDGGGLSNAAGGLLVINSTISGNEADLSGGGIFDMAVGAITVSLHSVTVASNVADGDANGSGDGGGIGLDGTSSVEMAGSILAGNIDSGGEAPDCVDIVSLGYNLIEVTTGCSIGGETTGNITGQDPELLPLGSYGGPTDTHALLPGSPAIDAGDPAGCTDDQGFPLVTDQRGVPRPLDGDGDGTPVCDMGAFELDPTIFTDGFESGDTSAWSATVP